MVTRTAFKAQFRGAALAAGAIGLAMAAPIACAQGAWSQGVKASQAAPEAKPANELGAVTVRARRRHHSYGVPPDRAAAFDADKAKDEAWQEYRDSTPAPNAGPLDLSKDYPGLRSYVPQQ